MKFSAVILSVLFLMLNMLPCADNAVSGSEDLALQEEICADKEPHSAADLCSPFCQQCHCCHVHATDLAVADLPVFSAEISTNIFLHFENAGEELLKSHFQPPRV